MLNKLGISTVPKIMLIFIPISFLCHYYLQSNILTFISSILAIIPIAIILGFATKQIALQTNPTMSGFLSATFGNIIELIIAIIALKNGFVEVVKASIAGSILVSVILIIGLSIFFGGLKYKQQKFNKTTVGISSTMLIIAVIAMTMPSLYSFIQQNSIDAQKLSNLVALVMATIYMMGLVFTMKTHKEIFDAIDEIKATKEKAVMNKKNAVLLLIIATIFASFVSELFVGGINVAASDFGFTQAFIGMVLIAILTNIAETVAAIRFARENKLDISMEIGLSGATQIALFVAPVLVFISSIFGYGFTLAFSAFQVLSLFLSVMIINFLSTDGESNWLVGAQLLSVYMIIAIAFFFV